MPDMPTFDAVGRLRCFHREDLGDRRPCGRPARFVRFANRATTPEYFCDRHHAATDQMVTGEQLVRRVSVTACVLFCGTSFQPTLAQAEALRQFEEAVEHAGGLVSLDTVSSQIGRWRVPAGYFQPLGPWARGVGQGVRN